MKKKPDENTRKRRLLARAAFLVLAGVCVIAAAVLFALFRPGEVKTYNGLRPAGTVNGEPFFQEDLDVYALELRAAVAADYGRRYNLFGVGEKFWDAKYGKSTPRETLYKLALDSLVRNMVLIQEARKRGIDTPGSYHDLETERADWNAPSEEIAYGPRELRSAEFNSYRITGISDELKTALLKEMTPGESQLRAAFDSLPSDLKHAPYFVSGDLFKWTGDSPAEGEIRAAFARGLDAEGAIGELAASFPGLTREDFEFNSDYTSKEDPYEQELARLFEKTYSGAFIRAPQGRKALYHVTVKKGGGMLTFEEAPRLGQNKWINDQFEIFLNKKIKAARIKKFAPAQQPPAG
ncbi:MAG: hypothetical protein LBF77_06230 [Spirochaetaceae bacterium]|jgi:hypothetical protein|nr:hypothetical protein [Spirochaetaceae bacterium]